MPKKTVKKTAKTTAKRSPRKKVLPVETVTSTPMSMPSMPSFPRFSSELLERFVPVLLVVCIALSFVVGVLWQKVSYLEKGNIAGVATAGTQQAATPPPTASLDTVKGLFDKDVIKFGDASRKVLFVEVADPSCPYCHIAGGHNGELNAQVGAQFTLAEDGGSYVAPVPEMKKLVDSGQAAFAYIYYPGHGNGELGMKALYCANEQGKFWPVHDKLMTSEGYDLLNDTVKNEVSNAGKLADFLASAIDRNFLKSCLESGKYDDHLANDMVIARDLYIQGTPGFYVNENSFPGAYSFTDMKSVVDASL